MDLEELQRKMQEIVDVAEAENRALTDEEAETYEGLETQLQAAQRTAEIRARQAAYGAPAGMPAVIHATGKGDEVLERAFENYLRTGVQNSDLVELRAQSIGTPSEGGYTVPEGFRKKLIEKMDSFGGIASVAEVINTSDGRPLPWPTEAAAASADDAAIVAENAQMTVGADLEFGEGSLGAFKYASVGASNLPLRVSVELLQDSAFDVSNYVARKLGERIRRKQAAHYATGAGTTEPLGLFTTTGDVTGALTYANAIEMIYSVDAAYRGSSRWVFNDAGVKALQLLVDGSNRPLWLPTTEGLEGKVGGNFLGYPVTIENGAPTMASGVAYAAFGDIREAYVIRNVKDITVVVNPYSRANFGQVEYVAWARSDGTIQNREAYATIKGA